MKLTALVFDAYGTFVRRAFRHASREACWPGRGAALSIAWRANSSVHLAAAMRAYRPLGSDYDALGIRACGRAFAGPER
jgi:hypothetical protein